MPKLKNLMLDQLLMMMKMTKVYYFISRIANLNKNLLIESNSRSNNEEDDDNKPRDDL
jgi:hypothetical protein